MTKRDCEAWFGVVVERINSNDSVGAQRVAVVARDLLIEERVGREKRQRADERELRRELAAA